MDNPGLTQQLKTLLLCGAGLLFAIFLGTQIGAENYPQLLLGAVIVIVGSISLFSGRFFWVLTIASSFLAGTFPILGGQFTPFQILMAIGVAKFLVGDVVLRRTKLKLGTRFDLLLIVGFMAILTWHGMQDRFGMRFLGSNVWGGRNYVNVYVGLAAFFVIQSIPIKPKLWAKLPYVILTVAAFDMVIAIITTVVPSSIYAIYPFYSAVSVAGVEEVLTGNVETARLSSVGNFGVALIILSLASISLRRILHPANFFRLLSLIAGSFAVLGSGFRSAVSSSLIAGAVAGVRDLRWAALALLPFLAVLLFGLSIVNSEFVRLPSQVQRSLAFIPGSWDVDAAQDAAASNDFRRKIWTLWWREYFPAHPLVGRGFGFRSDWAKTSVVAHGAYETQQTVETGNIHNGLFSALDAFGIVGTTFLVIWNFRLLSATFRVPVASNDPAKVALRFLGLYLATSIIFYSVGASSVGSFLPQEFAIASVFLRLQREISLQSSRAKSSEPTADILSEQFATT